MSGSSNIFDTGGDISITNSSSSGLTATQLSQITGGITSVSNQLSSLVSTIKYKKCPHSHKSRRIRNNTRRY